MVTVQYLSRKKGGLTHLIQNKNAFGQNSRKKNKTKGENFNEERVNNNLTTPYSFSPTGIYVHMGNNLYEEERVHNEAAKHF
jgi:hypothetical protein